MSFFPLFFRTFFFETLNMAWLDFTRFLFPFFCLFFCEHPPFVCLFSPVFLCVGIVGFVVVVVVVVLQGKDDAATSTRAARLFFLKRAESSFNGFHDASIPGARATGSMVFATVRRAAFAPPRAFSVVREAVSNRFADDVSRVTLVRVILGTPVL